MLIGSFEHSLDAKGRVSLPSSFRKELTTETDALVIVPSPTEKALYVFTPAKFEEWMCSLFEKEGGYNPRNRFHTQIRKRLMGNSAPITLDSAGRINVPKNLRDYAELDKSVTVLGNQDYIELWDTARCNAEMAAISDEEFANFFFTA